ncbi:MAG: hypothetical protein CVT59_00235 [Actinobacteria bacterium HGW-Actinobacteria-1]|nr:MAG: hypothetical protein CVT59_00235 [Actinobacteria bacterium HGW-Actinobacteria-1]
MGLGVDKKRLEGLDALRALAMLMVIVIHVTASRATPGAFNAATMLNAASRLGVCIFFGISGFLDQRSTSRQEAFSRWLRRRSGFLVGAYIIGSVAYLGLNHGVSLGLPWTARELVLYLGFGQAEWHLWFLLALAETIAVYWLMRRIGVSAGRLVVLAGLVFGFANLALFQQHSSLRLVAYFTCVDWLVYYALGAWVAVRSEAESVEFSVERWAAPAGVIGYCAFSLIGVTSAFERGLSPARIVWFLLSCALLVGSIVWATQRELRVPKFLSRLGAGTMAAYLVHMIPVRIAERAGYLTGYSWLRIALQVSAVLVITIALSSVAMWLLQVLRRLRIGQSI